MPEKLGGYGRNDWVGFAGISTRIEIILYWNKNMVKSSSSNFALFLT